MSGTANANSPSAMNTTFLSLGRFLITVLATLLFARAAHAAGLTVRGEVRSHSETDFGQIAPLKRDPGVSFWFFSCA